MILKIEPTSLIFRRMNFDTPDDRKIESEK